MHSPERTTIKLHRHRGHKHDKTETETVQKQNQLASHIARRLRKAPSFQGDLPLSFSSVKSISANGYSAEITLVIL